MKFIKNTLDKMRPNFEEGGKFYAFHSLFDAMDTFFLTPEATTTSGCHIRDAVDNKRTMFTVVIALIPALLFGMYNIGYQHYLSEGVIAAGDYCANFWGNFGYGLLKLLPMILVSYIVGLGIECIFAQVRKHEVSEGYFVTGMLIPLICPPDVPLWQLALAVAFAVIIGKEVFGGTGYNFLNPALVARAFLFFSYPIQMSGDTVWIAAQGDAISGATPLGEMIAGAAQPSASVLDMIIGFMPGSVGETSVIAILIGALILLVTGVASWRIMLSIFVGGAAMGLIFNAVGANEYMSMPFYYHFLMGGFMFGAVFMATDPVTAAHTNTGKYIYGFLIGVMAVLIRVVNPAYPEGMMLAILLLNVFAPLIDYYVVDANIRKRAKRAKLVSNK
ncbi:MAG: NADH:ubiquinone reductase (Na(+)-transporting) subunit B [Bacteroidales bacterium]|nr:NADH:ubiquinone reductase (Na(+)-transporting) subunit B [Bacteroidales bacterium]MBO7180495.1 NADH:ubiquinone reductase (Na(+)-transporting) subunit B [Bacteroidales bacterium]MBQ2386231.1 NADH:ubiquinone reductase (Na(+)-transporting) subunit B [Bacteroidales bacterium]MEE0909509.1 NADH:ubiquinone reductase (Na(+)-transporting) subunit B [Bacteroidales bacterium]MEE0917777.1 NADH:ubiquinone reductase (Na(+)-transporting) subunit B [Bacteroidales bacterium]